MRHEPLRELARRAAAARRPGLRRRGLAGDQEADRERRRGPDGPPPDEVGDFEEYTSLYRESWSDPALRWLLSTVSSAMIFDDHDVHDDWNISEAWIAQMRAKPWWEEPRHRRVHVLLDLPAPRQPLADGAASTTRSSAPCRTPTATARRSCATSPAPRCARSPARAGASAATSAARAWSSSTRARAACSPRAGARCSPTPSGTWVEDHCTRRLRPPRHRHVAAVHARAGHAPPRGLERGGLRRRVGAARARALGEKVRQALDLEHWAAFQGCFARLTVLLEDVAAGRRGRAPATISAAVGRRAPRLPRRGLVPRPRGAEPRAAGDVLAGAKPARQARAAGAALGVHATRGRVRAAAWRAPPASRPRRCAGASPRSRRSTTRSRGWTCAGARRSCASRRRCREDWRAPRLHTSLSLGDRAEEPGVDSLPARAWHSLARRRYSRAHVKKQ